MGRDLSWPLSRRCATAGVGSNPVVWSPRPSEVPRGGLSRRARSRSNHTRRARGVDGGPWLRAGGAQPWPLPRGGDGRPRRPDVRRDRRAGARASCSRPRSRPSRTATSTSGRRACTRSTRTNPFHVVTFARAPTSQTGDIERRVVFIRNDGDDTFTAIANTCMHLGCPVRAFGSVGLRLPVPRRPVRLRGPAHRGPAGAPAEPLRHQGRERPPRPRHAVRDGRRRCTGTSSRGRASP